MQNTSFAFAFAFASLVLAVGCGSDDVDSDEAARRAYLGLDGSIGKSINLGFQGFNLATNANIDAQTTAGEVAGTLTVVGKVDQGSSNNKTMRLNIGMVDYDEGDVVINDDGDKIRVVYDTATVVTEQPYLQLKLSNIPAFGSTATGMLEGSLTGNADGTGVYLLDGDLKGQLTLNLTITGTIMAGTTDGAVLRVPNMTTVTGTATNGDGGVYEINLTL